MPIERKFRARVAAGSFATMALTLVSWWTVSEDSCCAAPFAKCTGSSSCRACSNCSSCAHCSSGGSCGVCSRGASTSVAPPAGGSAGDPVDPGSAGGLAADGLPAAGSVVWLERPGGAGHAHVSVDFEAFRMLKAALASNDIGMFNRLSREDRVLRVPNGTRARVLKLGDGSRFVSLLEGERAGATGWVETRYIRDRDPAAPKAKAKPVDPAARAAADLTAGEALEIKGKVDAALKVYRGIVRDYPGSPQAEKAKGYIKALTGK